MPLADFDAMQAARRSENSCVVLGQRYDALPELPLSMGLDLMDSDRLDPAGQRDLLVRVFDFVFGAGALARFEADDRFSAAYCAQIVAFIRFGYRMELVEELEDLAKKNALALARMKMRAEMLMEAMAISDRTGVPLSQIFDASTASDSPPDDSTLPT